MRYFLFLFLFLVNIEAAPVKVPTHIYAGLNNKTNHPGYYPFISHLTFKNVCDIVIGESTEWFDPDMVQQGDIIYLNVWYLEWFTEQVHDKIKNPYILVTGDVSAWLPHPNLKKLLYDPKLAAWFCRNMVLSYHPKLFQIPMGQDFALFSHYMGLETLLNAIENLKTPKKHLLYMCHCPRAHGDRDKIIKLFEHEDYCFSRNHSDQPFQALSLKLFYEEVGSSEFILSPIGWETDCVRTWEAIVLDCIPIVEHTFLDPSYDRLPVLIVHDWQEINRAFLEEKIVELKNRSKEEAYFDYWAKLIYDVQRDIKNNDLSRSKLENTKFSNRDIEALKYILKRFDASSRLLHYMGFLSALRPLQIVNSISTIPGVVLCDPWIDQKLLKKFDSYLNDKIFLNKRKKINILNKDEFIKATSEKKACTLFLDLTYYRTSLFLNFRTSIIEYGNFRHSLKNDIKKIHKSLPKNSILIGNMMGDNYVNEVIGFLMAEGFVIEKYENFWFIKK